MPYDPLRFHFRTSMPPQGPQTRGLLCQPHVDTRGRGSGFSGWDYLGGNGLKLRVRSKTGGPTWEVKLHGGRGLHVGLSCSPPNDAMKQTHEQAFDVHLNCASTDCQHHCRSVKHSAGPLQSLDPDRMSTPAQAIVDTKPVGRWQHMHQRRCPYCFGSGG